MKSFFIGLHHPSDAWPFVNSMISINSIRVRKSGFRVNNWIMDSGAFTEISEHGRWRSEPECYADEINRWKQNGTLLAAVTQDVMCEPFILQKTGLTVEAHQEITIERYKRIVSACDAYVMPVLQGFEPRDYAAHIAMYGSILGFGQWTGVGSVCRRNSNPKAIEEVLEAINWVRPDLKLHGFGIKVTSLLTDRICDLLHSSDSMAWSTAGRKQGEDANDPRRALKYAAQVERVIGRQMFIQPQLLQWWS